MAALEAEARAPGNQAGGSREWNWRPETPIGVSPAFRWPPDLRGVYRWYRAVWLQPSTTLLWVVLAIGIFFLATPGFERAASLAPDWILFLYARNVALTLAFTGGLHVYFHGARRQGKALKFEHRELARKAKGFRFGDQVKDNMFWTLASGVTVWTGFEALYLWAAANGWAPMIGVSDNPVWFVLWLLIIPIWSSFHFYWIHRLIHAPALYERVHALHHRNINIGPWSGISMHPLEHLLYFSSLAIHFVVASHPIHFFFHMLVQALNPAASHSGFASLQVRGAARIPLGDFFHQLHHRYFECNYGTSECPLDAWFGTFHDGGDAATARVRARRKAMHGPGGRSGARP